MTEKLQNPFKINELITAVNSLVDSEGSSTPDNLSITQNASSNLQAVGVINQNATTTAIKTWTGTKAQYDAIVSKDSGTLYYLTDVQKIYYGNTLVCEKYNRNIGEIITSSIPLTDAGLHLLDGNLIQGGGIYDAFVQYMANLVNLYPQCFTDETTWQNIVSSKGICGKFVYDSANNTIRLPKFGNKVYTQDINEEASVIGNGMTIGVTDGTLSGSMAMSSNGLSARTTYVNPVGSTGGTGWPNNGKSVGLTTDPEKSGIITDLSNITQSIDCYYYIVVATSVKTQIIVDIDNIVADLNNIVADLNNKADKNLSNINPTSTLKEEVVGWGIPDWSAGVAVTLTTSKPYTVTSKCLMYVRCYIESNYCKIRVNGTEVANMGGSYNCSDSVYIPLDVGDVVTRQTWNSGEVRIFPYKGVNTNA